MYIVDSNCLFSIISAAMLLNRKELVRHIKEWAISFVWWCNYFHLFCLLKLSGICWKPANQMCPIKWPKPWAKRQISFTGLTISKLRIRSRLGNLPTDKSQGSFIFAFVSIFHHSIFFFSIWMTRDDLFNHYTMLVKLKIE